ncbi:hypothetical protein Tco_0682177 [Tanacetum coccineum]|uniref:Uncharacterized protein n=1 Tax=Tanacetum coccineum TaxID=301880 RepID=A0ABQ4XRS4_9ASTR
MPNCQTHFSNFYICFKALKEGWLEGCMRVIGIDGYFLKTIFKGELLSVVGRDTQPEAIVPLSGSQPLPSQEEEQSEGKDKEYMDDQEQMEEEEPVQRRTSERLKMKTFVVTSGGRGDRSKSKLYLDGIRPIGYGVSWDPVDEETMLGNSMGLPRAAWPAGITPEDVRIHAQ